jgi:hypothetical protein
VRGRARLKINGIRLERDPWNRGFVDSKSHHQGASLMSVVNLLISVLDVIASVLFAISIFRQYMARRKTHQLMWGIAIAIWAVAVGAELAATLQGRWGLITYRAYYATGALLIPAWLGMGTLYLILPRRVNNVILVILAVLSGLGVLLIATWSIDSATLYSASAGQVPLKVFPFFPIQLLLILLNSLGALAFILGALWSVVLFTWKRQNKERAVATGLIAIGGLVAAIAHSAGVISGIELFRISELIAVLFIFMGYLLSNAPSPNPSSTTTQLA